jgi:excisionase family DNA binding protein
MSSGSDVPAEEEERDQLVPMREAARMLGVSQSTLRMWDREGTLVPTRTLGGHRRYSYKELCAIQRHGMRPRGTP